MAASLSPAGSAELRLMPFDVSVRVGEHRYPSLYLISTCVWLNDLSWSFRSRTTLRDISDGELRN
jgi:hypothetical protein